MIRLPASSAALLCALFIGSTAPTVSVAEPFRLMQWPTVAPKSDFHLIGPDGRRLSVKDFRGQVVVVFFGFTHCPDVCPDELFKLSLVVRRLGSRGTKVRVVFISLDPQRDTPDLLKAYVRAFDPHFIGLTGSSADVNAAADSFSIQFAKVARGSDYTISHSTGTYVLDQSGRLSLVGTMQTRIDDWVHDLSLLAAGQ